MPNKKNGKNGTPPCVDGTKAHHWIINNLNIGRCTKCGLVKDFSDRKTKGRNVPDLMMRQMRLPKAWTATKRQMVL